jgi:hypothetical protein
MIEPIQVMYAESMRLSQRWAKEFRGFWELPDDFDFDVPTPTVELSKAMLAEEAAGVAAGTAAKVEGAAVESREGAR